MPVTISTTPSPLVENGLKRRRTEENASSHPRKVRKPLAEAILSTRNSRNVIDKLLVRVDHPITIGRHPASDYILHEKNISSKHCVVHAIMADNGSISVVCQDFSSNGIGINGHSFRGKSSLLLMDGDELTLPNSQSFRCELTRPTVTKLTQASQASQLSQEIAGRYIITKQTLGRGAYSSVKLAIDHRSRRQMACKTIVRQTQEDVADVLKEVELLRKLHHPNINSVYGFEAEGEKLYIFLELATGGDLFSYMVKNGALCEGEVKYIAFQLMKGLQYLHKKSISHRDLKPENILLATPGSYPRVLIADFGLAKEQAYEPTGNIAGTVSYLPPEAVHAMTVKEKYIVQATDAWSLGVIIFSMLQGYHPFDPCHCTVEQSQYPYDNNGKLAAPIDSEDLVQRRIVQKVLTFPKDEWRNMELAKDFISQLLVRDVKYRKTIKGALLHDWIQLEYHSLCAAYKDRVARDGLGGKEYD